MSVSVKCFSVKIASGEALNSIPTTTHVNCYQFS